MAKTITIELDDEAARALASVRVKVAELRGLDSVSEGEAIKAALEALDSAAGLRDLLPPEAIN